jgi:hypothetical protein
VQAADGDDIWVAELKRALIQLPLLTVLATYVKGADAEDVVRAGACIQ